MSSDDVVCHWHGLGLIESDDGWSCPACTKPSSVQALRDTITRLTAELAAERAECDEQARLVTAWRGVAEALYVGPPYDRGRRLYINLRDHGLGEHPTASAVGSTPTERAQA